MDDGDGELTSEFARDLLLANLEALGRALVAFQQAYLALAVVVKAHDGVVPTAVETRGRAVSGTAHG